VTSSAPPDALVLIVAFLAALPIVAAVSRRLRLPYTLSLVLVGLGVSALPIHETLAASPETTVAILLPGLVFEAAFRLDARELQRTAAGVAVLAVPGVVLTAAIVAVVLHVGAGVGLREAFVVGAIVSATDPVAVVSTMRRLRAPKRLVTLVDAESLFNDGTAALLFVIALAAWAPSPPSAAEDVVTFLVGLVASMAIGLLSGLIVSRAIAMTHDHLVELTLTVLAAYGTYLVATVVHESGIIASVVAGVVVGTYGRHRTFSDRALDFVDEVWDFLAFTLTGAAFLLIGLAIPLSTLVAAPAAILFGVVGVLLGRAVVVYGLVGIPALALRNRAPGRFPVAWLHVLNWTGLRGAVATALALSIPESISGREVLQGTVFGIVLFTLVVQGTTASWLLRRVGIGPADDDVAAPAQAR
jgi:CPA1 family monovalent cation:H+ antiporter